MDVVNVTKMLRNKSGSGLKDRLMSGIDSGRDYVRSKKQAIQDKLEDVSASISEKDAINAATSAGVGAAAGYLAGGDDFGEEQEILNDILEREANEEALTEDEVLLLKLLRSE